MFEVRKCAPVPPETPYKWGVESEGQCTWYTYYRAIEVGYTPPCYWDRETRTGSYTNAKLWLQNFREPWEVKGPDYRPVAGDIAVFDGEYGHVIFIENNNGLISEYNRIVKGGFDNDVWDFGTVLAGCGPLIGYLHFPNSSVAPVPRNEKVDQIETTDTSLRIRVQPNLNGEIVGHVQIGYYNVLSQTEADGYTWYQIEKDRWCANITTKYLPADDTDILSEIERYLESMKSKMQEMNKENIDLKERLNKINELSKV